MTTLAYPSGRGAPLGATPWQEWVAEVGLPALDSAQWAARALVQAVLVALAWPLRVAWLVLSRVRWGTGETVFCTVLAAGPVGLLVRLYPSVRWPTAEQALADLQHAAVVLTVAWLALYLLAGVSQTSRTGAAGYSVARSGPAGRTAMPCGCAVPTGKSGAGLRAFIAQHEAGHMAAGKYMTNGGGVHAKIFGQANGGAMWADRGLDALGALVTARAGRKAVRSNNGASWDMNKERQILRGFRGRERAEMSRQADQHVSQALRRYAGDRQRWARRLDRDGQVSA